MPEISLVGDLKVNLVEGRQIAREDFFSRSDPYITAQLIYATGATQFLGRTQTINNTRTPIWNKQFNVKINPERWSNAPELKLKLRVMDDDPGGEANHGFIGQTIIDLKTLLTDRLHDSQEWFPIYKDGYREARGEVFVCLHYEPRILQEGDEKIDSVERAVDGVYFDQTLNNSIRLYQDADISTCRQTTLPFIRLDDGRYYQHHSAWNDVHEAMTDAQYFIFITGWSVLPTISLLRSHSKTDERESFGELLKRKAASGVSVVFLDRKSVV